MEQIPGNIPKCLALSRSQVEALELKGNVPSGRVPMVARERHRWKQLSRSSSESRTPVQAVSEPVSSKSPLDSLGSRPSQGPSVGPATLRITCDQFWGLEKV